LNKVGNFYGQMPLNEHLITTYTLHVLNTSKSDSLTLPGAMKRMNGSEREMRK